MKIFLTHTKDLVFIMGRTDDNRVIADMSREVWPGQDFDGWSYDELRAMPEGPIELRDKSGPTR